MGVLNVTPDSFSDGGLWAEPSRAVARGKELATQGALIVDVGGESTRPGASPVEPHDEVDRVRPVIAELAESGVLVSVDTRRAEVAAAAIAAGAHIVNDVSGLADAEMVGVCAQTGTPVVIGHMPGTPMSMQREPRYVDVVTEVSEHLRRAATTALEAGVPSVMVDPGIGFGKSTSHNIELLRALPLDASSPVVVGASRKRFIAELAGSCPPDRRDPGSVAVHLFAAQRGVAMVRVHDVAGHVQALAMDTALRCSPARLWPA